MAYFVNQAKFPTMQPHQGQIIENRSTGKSLRQPKKFKAETKLNSNKIRIREEKCGRSLALYSSNCIKRFRET